MLFISWPDYSWQPVIRRPCLGPSLLDLPSLPPMLHQALSLLLSWFKCSPPNPPLCTYDKCTSELYQRHAGMGHPKETNQCNLTWGSNRYVFSPCVHAANDNPTGIRRFRLTNMLPISPQHIFPSRWPLDPSLPALQDKSFEPRLSAPPAPPTQVAAEGADPISPSLHCLRPPPKKDQCAQNVPHVAPPTASGRSMEPNTTAHPALPRLALPCSYLTLTLPFSPPSHAQGWQSGTASPAPPPLDSGSHALESDPSAVSRTHIPTAFRQHPAILSPTSGLAHCLAPPSYPLSCSPTSDLARRCLATRNKDRLWPCHGSAQPRPELITNPHNRNRQSGCNRCSVRLSCGCLPVVATGPRITSR
jgi:hypothetical protein